ncbi:MAG: DUF2461 domain-containing protein [Prevotella sp.]|nr:DUF2461 domain-containing protein [Prevotella sp.]
MDTNRIIEFLKDISANNNREWFLEHKEEYQAARASFEQGVDMLISHLVKMDPSVAHITVKDATYRFYRDTRFSPDKSPYKRHLGAYICAHGKKALHGGYYIHLEPDHCMLAVGSYWLPTNILTSCRNEIMANIDEWRKIVEKKTFVQLFGHPGKGVWDNHERGFGISHLINAPKGFPKDYEYLDYLKMKDYCCWRAVSNNFFEGDGWLEEAINTFRVAKPMMDFINGVIDDYE